MKYRLLGACAISICCTAAPALAQGLSRVEVLALQQQLRDDGCGASHITGRVDAATRADVKKCETKHSGATDPASMLAAMNIGFGNGIPAPTLATARGGAGGSMSAGGTSGLNNSSAHHGSTTDSPSRVMPTHPRDTSTMPRDTSSITRRDTMRMPMRKPDSKRKRPTMPKRDTMPNTH